MSPEEKARLVARAEEDGVSVSELVRSAMVLEVDLYAQIHPPSPDPPVVASSSPARSPLEDRLGRFK